MTEHSIPDIQGRADTRKLPIGRVGIRDLRMPLQFVTTDGRTQSTVAMVEMTVALPHDQKGTHMSRFIELMNETTSVTVADIHELHQQMLSRLHAEEGTLTLGFPYFMYKTAPISGVQSMLDYEVSIIVDGGHDAVVYVEVSVPVTSLCPCSKEISDYGAHNQRSFIVMTVEFEHIDVINIDYLIRTAEAQSSCEIWATLKRPDEKFVTEQAYDNPKFVEDIVRDVALQFNDNTRIVAYRVSSENLESIHNHSAYAVIEHDKRTQA